MNIGFKFLKVLAVVVIAASVVFGQKGGTTGPLTWSISDGTERFALFFCCGE